MKQGLTAEDRKKLIEKLRTDHRSLCKVVLGMRDWSGVHDELSQFLESEGRFKLIQLPRGHLKSSVVTIGKTIQKLLRNPDMRVLIANAVSDNAENFLKAIQNYLTVGSSLPELFGPFQTNTWNKEACIIRQRRKVSASPTIATAGVGKELTSQHYDLIILDDLVARQNSQTAEMRRQVEGFYDDVLNLLEPDGELWVVGTRWHQKDLYSRFLDDRDFKVFIRTALKKDGTPTFPEKFTPEHIQDLRRKLGPYNFAAQYMNSPIDEDSSDFKKAWIKYWSELPGLNLYLSVDPAASLSAESDPTAMALIGMDSDRKIHVVDYARERMTTSGLINKVFEFVEKYKLKRVGVEAFAYQKSLRMGLEEEMRSRGIYFQVDELRKTRGASGEERVDSKNERIRGLVPLFEHGRILIAPWMAELEDELLSFPRGKHDDLLDALSYSVDKLWPASRTAEKPVIKEWTMGALLEQTRARQGNGLYKRFLEDFKEPVMPFQGWKS